jgi:hypothetical protein
MAAAVIIVPCSTDVLSAMSPSLVAEANTPILHFKAGLSR